ncbi:SigE family RNA polymerase sigma factor [Virgisporangium aurantiacum]|uniref:RNA polymerase sigma24 factor n=1 Tax=Virgisporangium aurantiacum TaxID=175570 RepID=A0A8J3Z3Q0_9ACTN|nr:SigE family RNA polymerase sigma factor [Virgisporangium aurantiacum]GIJ55807.1 RNA polymerase sigma24 factor [Virgisporangium aurantiacum]
MSSEHEQFAAYFAARRDKVRRAAYLLCGDWHFADDLAQMAFVRLAQSWRRVRDRDALDAYVQTTLIRVYIAENRRWFRRRERTTDTVADPVLITVDRDGMADSVGRKLAVLAALRRLPPGQRAVLVARYFGDLSVAATAEALSCSTGTVKSQAARAINTMREYLSPLGMTIEGAIGDEVRDEPVRRV